MLFLLEQDSLAVSFIRWTISWPLFIQKLAQFFKLCFCLNCGSCILYCSPGPWYSGQGQLSYTSLFPPVCTFLLVESKEGVRWCTLGSHIKRRSAGENQSRIPQFSLYDSFIFSPAALEPLVWEMAWHWASRIHNEIPPSLRKYIYGKTQEHIMEKMFLSL